MLNIALKLLKELTEHSYKAYIVGGFVRDYILGIESNDIDIATNATPMQIKEIFEDSCLPSEDYGSVIVIKNGIRFDITTFRREISYVNNRKPLEIEYIDNLKDDLLRRDFTINTLCMDCDGNVIDLLNGKADIDNKLIKVVGNSYDKFSEDSLRILRAIRFATILDFDLDNDVCDAIFKTKHLLKDLSYYRKKCELEKIFLSSNYAKGVKLLLDFGIDHELEISNLEKLLKVDCTSLIGIWSILNPSMKYPFNKNELDLIKKVNSAVKLNNMDPMALYKYGLYVNSVAGEIKGADVKKITESYNSLIIKSRSDLAIDSSTIMNILGKNPGHYLSDIYNDIEREILYRRLNNDKKSISLYILSKYGGNL